jgi:gluconokinase
VSELRVVVVMGVSGSGKSTVARALADRLGCELLEGDDLHPPANVAAMAAGRPLTDAERGPWLTAIGDWIDARAEAGVGAVVTCSALRRSYRDQLRDGRPSVGFCHLTVDPVVLERRMATRSGHFMPASLLRSQLTTLEPLAPDEPGVAVASDAPVESVVDDVVRRLDLRCDPPRSSAQTDPLD